MATISLRRTSQRHLTRIVIPLFIAAAIIVNILAPIFALAWAQQPFPDRLLYPWLIVSGSYGAAGAQSGMRPETASVLSGVDGMPVASGRDLYLLMGQKRVDETVSLTLDPVQSSSASETVSVGLKPFPGSIFLTFFWLPYGIGLIYLVLGGTVYHLRGDKRTGGMFVIFCASVSILMGAIFDQLTFHFLTPLWAFILPLVGASLVYLAFVFPAETRLIRRRPWLGFIPYGLALILGIANLFSLYGANSPRLFLSLWLWNIGFVSLSILVFLGLLVDARFTTLSAQIRQQIGVIFWGSLLSFGPAAIWASGWALGFDLFLSWTFFLAILSPLLIFPIVIIFATLRYRLLDLDLVFSRGVTYLVLVLLTASVYFVIVSGLGRLLQDNLLFRNPIILAVFILALVIFLEPARQRIQTAVNRRFLLESFDAREMLQQYGRDLVSSPLNLDHIIKRLLKQADEALAPEYATVFLKDSSQDIFSIRQERGTSGMEAVEVSFGQDDDLAQWLASTNTILQLRPEGGPPPEVDIAPEEVARLHMLNIALCVPLLGSDNLLGWLALGLKKSGHPYTSNDLAFLSTLASQTTIALENARFLEQANRRAAELEALQKITLDIQAEVEPDQLLTSVVEQATQLLRAEGGMALLLEPDNETLKVVVSYQLDKDYTGSTLNKEEGIAGQVLKQGQPVIVENYSHFQDRSREFQEAKFGAVMGIPLRWRDKVRGVLYLVHRPRGLRFSRDDVWLMEFFATQSAIALDKSQLLQEARSQASQLTTLIEVSTSISSTLDLDTALQQVMDRAVEILHAEAGSLLLMDRYGQELAFEVALGPTGADLLGEKIPVGTGIVGTVAATGKPLIINDVAADPRWEISFDEATDFHSRDILCVPMIAREQVVGVIELINKQDQTVFKEEDRDLLLSFAAQAAIVIENAQIFTQTDQALAERIQELQTLQMFDQALQTSLELDHVLDITLTHAMDSLGLAMGLMGIMKDQEETGLYLLAQHGMPMEMARYKKDPWPLTKGVIGRVARTGEPAWINDITKEPNYIPKNHRTRSLLVVPVLREGRVISVIDLESTDPDYFTSADMAFVKGLANHAAIAIENAQLFEQVNQANQAKTEFMSTASHELKIPMTSIKGYAKLLGMGAGGPLSDQQREFVHVIVNNVDRMSQLVNDLLDVSRIEAGRIRLEIRDVQMEDVIQEVLESIQTQIENKKLNLKVDLAQNLPELRADYNRIVQIVTNLLSNAYKYTPEEGTITVVAKPQNNGDIEGIAVTVQDTGFGISEEDQAKLFNTFFRSSDQSVRDQPGTGLGLSITKKMVESHGGELTFESKLGQGSSFTFTMPLICEIPPGVEVVER